MPWKNQPPKQDPAYQTTQWKKNQQYWRKQRKNCARCGGPIDYNNPYWTNKNGRKTINPRALVVGHIVAKSEARKLGWPETKTNALNNTQPECAACSITSGAKQGAKQRNTKTPTQKPPTTKRYI